MYMCIIFLQLSYKWWWPNGEGEQSLYDFTVLWQPRDSPKATDEIKKKLGFRTVELIQTPMTKGVI